MGTLRAIGLSALLTVLLAELCVRSAGADAGWVLDRRRAGLRLDGLELRRLRRSRPCGAPSGYLKLGTTLRQNVLLGVETNAWTKSELGVRLTMANISGAVYWYPMATNGMFVKAGAGYSALDAGGGGTNGLRHSRWRWLRRPHDPQPVDHAGGELVPRWL